MTRLGRFGMVALAVISLYLLGTLVHQVGALNNRLGNAQGQLAEKDRQLAARDANVAQLTRTVSASAVQQGQYLAIITALTRQLQRAGLQPVVRPEDVPQPQPGPPVVTPRPRPSAGPTARPKPKPSGHPKPHPSPTPCTVANPLPVGPRCLPPTPS